MTDLTASSAQLEGWILAPAKPDESMLEAFHVAVNAWMDEKGEDEDVYLAMLGAISITDPLVKAFSDRIIALQEQNKILREALQPFASEADEWKEFDDTEPLVEGFAEVDSSVTVGDLRRAKAAVTHAGL